jgi:hypothetical protein
MKDQEIRLIDVFVLGPLMIRSGWLNRSKSPITSYLMMFAGGATIAYNWQNFRKVRQTEPKTEIQTA